MPISSEECLEEGEMHLNLEKAIWWALNFNRQIINNSESYIKAEYQVTIADSEFDLLIKPTGEAGYVGGGYAGTGVATAAGLEFSKKFNYGTKIHLTPSISKVSKIYHCDVNGRITQPLLRGFGKEYTLNSLRIAQFSLRSTDRALYLAQCKLILRTITNLYELKKAERSVQLHDESYRRVKKFYQAALLKAQIGLSDPLDIYRAEIEMRQAEDALKVSQERFQETEDHLRDLLALPLEVPLKISLPLKHTPIGLPLDQAIEMGIENRVELDQANDQEFENKRLAKIAKEKLWPELNLIVNLANTGNDEIFGNCWSRRRESTWGFGFSTSTDINPVADQAVYEQSILAVDMAMRNIDQTVANISFEIKSIMRNLERVYQRIELQKEQIKTGEGELRLSQIKFDRGMANNFDLIQAEKSLRNAQLSHWNSLIDHIIGEYRLLEAMGVLMERPS